MVKNRNNSREAPKRVVMKYISFSKNVIKNPNSARLIPNPSIALDWNKSLLYDSTLNSFMNTYLKILSKNYTPQSISDKGKTHEGAVAPTRADFVSRGTAFNKKTPLFFFEEVGVFPNSANAELLLKAYIMPNSCGELQVLSNLTEVRK